MSKSPSPRARTELVDRAAKAVSQPVEIDGVTYGSIRVACLAHRVNTTTVYQWLRQGKGKRLPATRGYPVELGGVSYPSVAACARALGIKPHQVRMRIEIETRLRAIEELTKAGIL